MRSRPRLHAFTMALAVSCLSLPWLMDLGPAPILLVLLVFASGIGLRLLTSARRHARLVRLLRLQSRSIVVDDIRVREGAFGGAAFVAGLGRPEIFIDQWTLDSLTPDERRAVLLHEQAHLTSRDPLRMLVEGGLATFVRRLPGGRAWLTDRAARREILADRAALHAGASRGAIASALLKVAPVADPAAGFGGVLDQRVAALAGERDLPRVSVHAAGLLGLAMGALGCLVLLHPTVTVPLAVCCH